MSENIETGHLSVKAVKAAMKAISFIEVDSGGVWGRTSGKGERILLGPPAGEPGTRVVQLSVLKESVRRASLLKATTFPLEALASGFGDVFASPPVPMPDLESPALASHPVDHVLVAIPFASDDITRTALTGVAFAGGSLAATNGHVAILLGSNESDFTRAVRMSKELAGWIKLYRKGHTIKVDANAWALVNDATGQVVGHGNLPALAFPSLSQIMPSGDEPGGFWLDAAVLPALDAEIRMLKSDRTEAWRPTLFGFAPRADQKSDYMMAAKYAELMGATIKALPAFRLKPQKSAEDPFSPFVFRIMEDETMKGSIVVMPMRA